MNQIYNSCSSRDFPIATAVEIPRLNTQSNMLDFESNSSDTTSSCATSSVNQDLSFEPKSEDLTEQVTDACTLYLLTMKFLLIFLLCKCDFR